MLRVFLVHRVGKVTLVGRLHLDQRESPEIPEDLDELETKDEMVCMHHARHC